MDKTRSGLSGDIVQSHSSPIHANRFLDFTNTQGIIFVVDSNDRERASEARDELHSMLRDDELRDAVLLVFANKQDLPEAMPTAELTNQLGLHEIRNRPWYIQGACAASGDGIVEGIVLMNLVLTI